MSSLSPSLFESPDWSAHSFIEHALSPSVTLDGLQQSLESLDHALHSSLVSLINQEYANFIGLSSSLTGVDDHLMRIDEWVSQMKSKLQAVHVLVHSARIEREKKRAELIDSQQRIAFLKLLQSVIDHSKVIAQQIKLIEEWQKVIEYERNGSSSESISLVDVSNVSMQAKYLIHQSVKKHQSISHSSGQFALRRSSQARRGSIDVYDSDDDDDDDDLELPHNHHSLTHSHSAHDSHSINHSINPSYDLFNQLLASPASSFSPELAEEAHEQRILFHLTHACHLMQTLRTAQTITRRFTIIEELRPAIESMNQSLDSLIQAAILRAIATNDKHSALGVLMRICVLTDRLSTLHAFIRSSFISPRISNILTRIPLSIDPNNESEPSNLQQIYDELMSFVGASIQQLSVSAAFAPSLCNWHQLCFDEIVSAMNNPSIAPELASQLPAPGVPSLFHHHYILTQKFLTSFESAMQHALSSSGQSADLASFRLQPSYLALQKRFNVIIYYRLRQQQIASDIEQELVKPLSETSPTAVVALIQSSALRCWQSDVWLSELTGSFTKLTMQLVQRFVAWSSQHTTAVAKPPQTEASELLVSNRSSSPMPAEPSSNSPFLLSLYVASSRLSTWLLADLLPKIVERSGDSVSAQAVVEACQTSLSGLNENVLREVTNSLVAPMIIALSPMQRLKTTFRMTQAQSPAPSPYILNVIKLLKSAQETVQQASDPSAASMLLNSVLSSLYMTYEKEIKQVIGMVIKTEVSLNMMRNRSGTVAPGNETQDSDRIRAQLELDVTELAKAVHELNGAIGKKAHDDVEALHDVVKNAGAQ